MIDQHLTILQIVIPLLSAPLCVLIRSRRIVLGYTIAVCWIVLLLATRLIERVLTEGVLSYELGGWPAPRGIEYRVDALGAYMVWVKGAAPASVWQSVPVLWLLTAGFGLLLVAMVTLVQFTGGERGGTYHPPEIKDGVIKPGEID